MVKKLFLILLALVVAVGIIGFVKRDQTVFSWHDGDVDRYYGTSPIRFQTCGYKGIWIKDWEFVKIISRNCSNL